MSTSTPPVVKLSTTASLLALLPHLTAVPLRNSLVIAPFVGKQTWRAMRIPIEPSPSANAARSLASVALGSLSKLKDCDSVAVALFRDEPFRDVGPQWHDAVGVVLERLNQSGFHIKDAAIVAGDGWMPYFDGDLEVPRSLSEIEVEAAGIPVDAGADNVWTLPETDPELARRVADHLIDRYFEHSERDSFGRLRRVTPRDPVGLLESALMDDPAGASALTLARLVAQIDSEGAVDRTVLQIAFGRATGALSWSNTLALRVAAAEAGCEPNDILMEQDERGIVSPQTERLANLSTGQTREIPSPERLRAGAILLGRAIAHSPLPDRAWIMCAFAWVQWASGLTNSALESIIETRRLVPGNSLAPVYHTVFANMQPEWVFTTIPPNRAARRRASKKSR
ncbi:hypothetical protein GCM10027568_06670 [Humibacter soli]